MSGFGARLRETRKAKGLTQKDLGAFIGLGNGAIAALESGQNDPRFEVLTGLAAALNVSLDYLCFGKDQPAPYKVEPWPDSPIVAERDTAVEYARTILTHTVSQLPGEDVDLLLGMAKLMRDRIGSKGRSPTTDEEAAEFMNSSAPKEAKSRK